jgi:hypothetical protein
MGGAVRRAPTVAPAGFDVVFRQGPSIVNELVEYYGEPSKGLMAARKGNRWGTSDGIDAGTGKPFTEADIEMMRAGLDELIVLD